MKRAVGWTFITAIAALVPFGAVGFLLWANRDRILVKMTSGRVRNRNRAEGVLPQLQELLDAWETQGTHDVMVASDGGLRTDSMAQLAKAKLGLSKATSLKSTPHGRGAALDVWPVSFVPYVNGSWEKVPAEVKKQFEDFGKFAEARGLVWGGKWRSATFPNGDQPHVEIPQWATLPYPPTHLTKVIV